MDEKKDRFCSVRTGEGEAGAAQAIPDGYRSINGESAQVEGDPVKEAQGCGYCGA